MSQKIDKDGNMLGTYGSRDLARRRFPDPRTQRNSLNLYFLQYDLIWDVTETRIKVSYRPKFRGAEGRATTQLAKQLEASLGSASKSCSSNKESRSHDLQKDIDITNKAITTRRTRANALPAVLAASALTLLNVPERISNRASSSIYSSKNRSSSIAIEQCRVSISSIKIIVETDSFKPGNDCSPAVELPNSHDTRAGSVPQGSKSHEIKFCLADRLR